jgi:hypothetical protein
MDSTGGVTGNPTTGVNPTFTSVSDTFFAVNQYTSAIGTNFGQFPWRYDPPSGFVALSTDNLSEPAISNVAAEKPEDYFNTVLYDGNATDGNSITGVGFQPDLIWTKTRDSSNEHFVMDSVRGTGFGFEITSTYGDITGNQFLASFDSDGFTLNSGARANRTGENHAAWCWKAGGTAVSNNAGSIASQVSANTDSGFSIVSYTGDDNVSATIGHGIGATPKVVIVKCRSTAGTYWTTYHAEISSGTNGFLELNSSAGQQNGAFFGATQTFNSNVFSVGMPGTASNSTNVSGRTYIAYCWAEVEGFSKFGTYTANNDNNGPFVYIGFRPALIIIKETGGSGAWNILDAKRDPYNATLTGNHLLANAPNAEQTAASRSPTFSVEFLSNGFKLRGSHDEINEGTNKYVYMAFADSPYKYSAAR